MPVVSDLVRVRITIRGAEFEPLPADGDAGAAWLLATSQERRDYWRHLANLAFKAKLREIHKAVNVDGSKMRPRKWPRPDGAKGPVLTPHYSDSRYQTRLRWDGGLDPYTSEGYAALWWTREWARIVGYHSRGEVPGAPVRDHVGLTRPEQTRLARDARAWWAGQVAARRPDPVRTADGVTVDLSRYTLTPGAAEQIRGASYFTGFRRVAVARFTEADRQAALRRVFGGGPPPPAGGGPTPKPPRKPTPASTAPPRQPGQPIPAGPIADRLAAYEEGDRKVAALKASAGNLAPARKAVEAAEKAVRKAVRERDNVVWRANKGKLPWADVPAEEARLTAPVRAAERALREAQAALAAAQVEARERAVAVIRATDPVRFGWEPPSLGRLPLGGRLQAPDDRLREQIEQGLGWLSQVVERGGTAAEMRLRVSVAAGERSYHTQTRWGHDVMLGADISAHTVVHEFGHGIEHRLAGAEILQRGREYLMRRVGPDTRTAPLMDVEPTYEAHERYFPAADFARAFAGSESRRKSSGAYAAKDYSGGGTELISMGLEQLYIDPAGFAARDPEWCKFILGILDGSLR